MTRIISSILEKDTSEYFASTKNRFFNLKRPIQATKDKKEDFFLYLTTPINDIVLLEPLFAIDFSIHLLNSFASFARAIYFLSIMNEIKSSLEIEKKFDKEFSDCFVHLMGAASAFVAYSLNSILSVLALITRPIASLLKAIQEDTSNSNDLLLNPQSVF